MKYYFWCVPWTKKSIRYVYSSTVYGVYFCTITGNNDNYNITWPVIDQTKQLDRVKVQNVLWPPAYEKNLLSGSTPFSRGITIP